VTVEEEEETAWPSGPGPAEGEETAWPSGPGTDVLFLLEKCSAALIVLETCIEKFSETDTEESLK
jgi:hypothetical protein